MIKLDIDQLQTHPYNADATDKHAARAILVIVSFKDYIVYARE
jgi:hypothetical protein